MACSNLGLQRGDQTRLETVDFGRVGEDLDDLDNVHVHPVVVEDCEGALQVRQLDFGGGRDLEVTGIWRLDQEDKELVVGALFPGLLLRGAVGFGQVEVAKDHEVDDEGLPVLARPGQQDGPLPVQSV